MKGFDDHLDNYGDPDPGDDLPEPAFTIYDDALYDTLSDDEPTVVVEGREYDILASGDVVCPECGASRSVGRIADHMASEHSDDDELGDPRPPGNLPYYPDESHYYFYHEPPFDENHYRYHTPAGPNPACVNCRWLTWDQPREETGNE